MLRRHVERMIEQDFSCLLHGKIIDWQKLLNDLQYKKLTAEQRRKKEDRSTDKKMQAYWEKAVKYVEDPDCPHPGKLIEQDFVYSRQMRIHEVDSICVSV